MHKKIIINAIAAVLAMGLNTASAAANQAQPAPMPPMPAPEGMEKCYGVAKAGMNDCGTSSHNCSGESKADRDSEAWVAMPHGLCQRLAGGSTKEPIKS
jgi:uncharacterized membrane protein